jgi:hypothetical protein
VFSVCLPLSSLLAQTNQTRSKNRGHSVQVDGTAKVQLTILPSHTSQDTLIQETNLYYQNQESCSSRISMTAAASAVSSRGVDKLDTAPDSLFLSQDQEYLVNLSVEASVTTAASSSPHSS